VHKNKSLTSTTEVAAVTGG